MAATPLYREAWLSGPRSTTIYTRTYVPRSSPPKAALVFLHGSPEHVGLYQQVHERWAEHGIAVFAYDQCGFGRTALRGGRGKYGSISHLVEDVSWAVACAREQIGTVPVFLMGHSLGGTIGLLFAIGHSKRDVSDPATPLAGVVITSPFIRACVPLSTAQRLFVRTLANIMPGVQVSNTVLPEAVSHDVTSGRVYVEDHFLRRGVCLRQLGALVRMRAPVKKLLTQDYQFWPPSLPVLLIHGTGDKVTSHEATQQLYNNLPAIDKQLSLYDDAYHGLYFEDVAIKNKLFEECLAWVMVRLNKQEVKDASGVHEVAGNKTTAG